MDTGDTLIAHLKPAESMKPSEGSLDDPTVLAESFLGFYATTCDSRGDVPLAAGIATLPEVIPLVGVEFLGSAPWETALPAKGRDRVQQMFEHHGVVHVPRRDHGGERGAFRINNDVMLGSRPSAIYRAWAGFFAPLFAWTLDESKAARSQLMRSA